MISALTKWKRITSDWLVELFIRSCCFIKFRTHPPPPLPLSPQWYFNVPDNPPQRPVPAESRVFLWRRIPVKPSESYPHKHATSSEYPRKETTSAASFVLKQVFASCVGTIGYICSSSSAAAAAHDSAFWKLPVRCGCGGDVMLMFACSNRLRPGFIFTFTPS